MIPFFDYQRVLKGFRAEIDTAIASVLDGGQLILGPEVSAFEQEFAEFCRVRHGVGVNSGTDALQLALKAVGVGPGDEVVTVANTTAPTVSAIRAVGATPVFVEVDPQNLLMDVDKIAPVLSAKTKAIVPVHLYGLPVDMPRLMTLAEARDLRVIEDCAHAHGAEIEGRPAGSWGDIGCFSFYPTKVLGAYGDAGICTTNSVELAHKLASLRMYGYQHGHRIASEDGYNSRLDEMQAAILRVLLKRLPQFIDARRQIAAAYSQLLDAERIQLPQLTFSDRTHVWHHYVLRTKKRDELTRALNAEGVGCGIYYGTPLYQMPAFRSFAPRAPLAVTEAACGSVLSLPIFPGLTRDEIEHAAQLVNRALV